MDNKHMKRYSASLAIKEIQTKSQWNTIQFTFTRMTKIKKTSGGEDVEKPEPSYTVGGNVNWCSHYGEQYGDSSKG